MPRRLPYNADTAFGCNALDALTIEEIEAAHSLRCGSESTEIPRENVEDLPLSKFYREYLLPNRPVVVCGVTQKWGATREWVTKEGIPDVSELQTIFHGAEVVVESPADQCRSTTTAEAYLESWQTGAFYLKDWHMARDFPKEAARWEAGENRINF